MRDFKADRGFILTAQNRGDVDYIRMAYALALSLLATQKETTRLTLITDDPDKVDSRYKWAFDEIQPVWLGDSTWNLNNPYANEWKTFHVTPYKNTIKLEADMLALSDISHYWTALEDHDVYIPSTVHDYRGKPADTSYYRQTFIQNEIYNAFSAMTYFRQSYESWMFFKMCEKLFTQWQDYSWQQLWQVPQKVASTDVVWGLATTLLERENDYWSPRNLTFTHMKSLCQSWDYPNLTDVNWTQYAQVRFTDDCNIFVDGYKQQGLFHYVDKNFITEEILQSYERFLNV